MATLHFHIGARPLFSQPLRGGRVMIGRSDACDLALPGDHVSRIHAVLDERAGQWWITDRSRHGVRVNGTPIERVKLQDGDTIELGGYSARFWSKASDDSRSPTATTPQWSGLPEELVEVDEEGFIACRAVLRITGGPSKGQSYALTRSRLSIGGTGADLAILPDLPSDALKLRVARGRVMAEPGSVPARLAGQPIRELVPALRGEQIDLGPHALLVEVEAAREVHEADGFGQMVGNSRQMRHLFAVLGRMAAHDYPVLLLGESGTGKELAARALHTQSPRATGPFVAVNCAAIAATLFESELFGHEKGAFTGAEESRDGAFQRASGGVLFLDEIGELGLEEQAKLLRALEPGGGVRRVGASSATHPDVRVVAATNRDLSAMVSEGAFRNDLYHRLNMLTVQLPPLRSRATDIPDLAIALLARKHPGATLSEDAMHALQQYHWPGNVRELLNVLTRAVVMSGEHIASSHLSFLPDSFETRPTGDQALSSLNPGDVERAKVVAALEEADGNRSKAARILGIPRSSLLYKIKRFELG